MPYLPNINLYLQQSSLLLQAYPTTTRITTKYSLPPKPKPKTLEVQPDPSLPPVETTKAARKCHPPVATLILKTFETTAGICLKYRTNKSAEVGRLMTGLGRLAKGEIIEESNTALVGSEAKVEDMEVDAPPSVEKPPESAATGDKAGKARKKRGKK